MTERPHAGSIEAKFISVLATTSRICCFTSSLAAWAAAMCSAPMYSVISEIITVMPMSTMMSAAFPTAGLADSPENASEAPHSKAIIRPSSGQSTRSTFEASSRKLRATFSAASAAAKVSPSSWTVTSAHLAPAACAISMTCWPTTVSHPSATSTVAYTLGLDAMPAKTRVISSLATGSRVQPYGCVMG